MIDGSEKRNRQLAFELHNSYVSEKGSNQERIFFCKHIATNESDGNKIQLPQSKTGNLCFTDFRLFLLIIELFIVGKIC